MGGLGDLFQCFELIKAQEKELEKKDDFIKKLECRLEAIEQSSKSMNCKCIQTDDDECVDEVDTDESMTNSHTSHETTTAIPKQKAEPNDDSDCNFEARFDLRVQNLEQKIEQLTQKVESNDDSECDFDGRIDELERAFQDKMQEKLDILLNSFIRILPENHHPSETSWCKDQLFRYPVGFSFPYGNEAGPICHVICQMISNGEITGLSFLCKSTKMNSYIEPIIYTIVKYGNVAAMTYLAANYPHVLKINNTNPLFKDTLMARSADTIFIQKVYEIMKILIKKKWYLPQADELSLICDEAEKKEIRKMINNS